MCVCVCVCVLFVCCCWFFCLFCFVLFFWLFFLTFIQLSPSLNYQGQISFPHVTSICKGDVREFFGERKDCRRLSQVKLKVKVLNVPGQKESLLVKLRGKAGKITMYDSDRICDVEKITCGYFLTRALKDGV